MSLAVKSPAGITMMLRELLKIPIVVLAPRDLEVTFLSMSPVRLELDGPAMSLVVKQANLMCSS